MRPINVLVRRISITCTIVTFFYVGLFFALQKALLLILSAIFFIVYLIITLLTHYASNNYAKWLVLINSIATIFLFSFILGEASGIHYAALFLPIMAYTFYESNKKWLFWFFMGILGCLFLALMVYFELFSVQYIASSKINRLILLTAITSTIAISLLCIHFFTRELNIHIQSLSISNTKLTASFNSLKKVKADVQQLEELDGYNKVVQNIAHEFKNPLTFIRGTLELEIQDGRHDEYTTDVFTSLLDTFDRINYLIPKLLGYDFAQDPGGQYLVFDPNPVLTKLFKMTEATCKHNGIQQTLVAQSTHVIYGIRQALIQVIINLFTNAIDALQLTSGKRTITVSTIDDTIPSDMDNPRSAVKFTVQDSGPGIPEQLLDHFMLPYSSSKRKNRKNVGLGLPIVARIIHEHNGHFSYEPNHPTGATFHFWIPTPTPEDVERAKSLEEPPLFFLDDDWFKPSASKETP